MFCCFRLSVIMRLKVVAREIDSFPKRILVFSNRKKTIMKGLSSPKEKNGVANCLIIKIAILLS